MTNVEPNGKRFLMMVIGIQSTILVSLMGGMFSWFAGELKDLRKIETESLAAQTAAKLDERTNMWVPIIQENTRRTTLNNERLAVLEAHVSMLENRK